MSDLRTNQPNRLNSLRVEPGGLYEEGRAEEIAHAAALQRLKARQDAEAHYLLKEARTKAGWVYLYDLCASSWPVIRLGICLTLWCGLCAAFLAGTLSPWVGWPGLGVAVAVTYAVWLGGAVEMEE